MDNFIEVEKKKSVFFTYNEGVSPKELDYLNESLFRVIISLPIKQVHITFVDLQLTGGIADLTKHLDKSLYSIITDNHQLDTLFSSLKERMVNVLEEYGDIVEYQEKNKEFKYPYEVIVWLGYLKKNDSYYFFIPLLIVLYIPQTSKSPITLCPSN